MKKTSPPPARYATARNLARPSLGGVVAELSKKIRGKTLMPWQQQVANVACELSTEFPGEFQYQTIIITVPRQAGKSDLLGAIHLQRLLAYKNHLAIMTAQTGKDANKRWNGIIKDIPTDDLERRFKVNRGKGGEALTFLKTRSSLYPFAPTPKSIHGDAINLASIDEAWAFTQPAGAALESAIKPTFLTVPNSQLWIVSTRGTANSAWLNEKIALGRAATKDPASRTAFFEWSANPELADAEPYSDKTLAFHPAIGFTQTARKIRDLGAGADISLGEWRRSYLNLDTEVTETAFDLAVWDSLRWNYELDGAAKERYIPLSHQDIILTFDVAADGSSATIAAGWLDENNNPATAIVATASGTAWLRSSLQQLARKNYRAICCDDSGSNSTIIDDLSEAIDFEIYSYKMYRNANQAFIDRMRESSLSHDGNKVVRENIKNAVLRSTASGRIIDASRSAGAVDALRATVLAQHAAATMLAAPVIQIF